MNCKNKTNDGNNWKSTVVKSDVWKKGKGRKGSGKGFGKKGKLNELTETEQESDWTWTSWGQNEDWQDSEWIADDWTAWDSQGWTSPDWTHDGQVEQFGPHTSYRESGQAEEHPIGSLVLSPLFTRHRHEHLWTPRIGRWFGSEFISARSFQQLERPELCTWFDRIRRSGSGQWCRP